MKIFKVLNLYAGIGGNRKLWPENIIINGVKYVIHVTAVEHNKEIAAIYQDLFPNDKVVVGDAHKYLLKHYKEFDFIWASPPCPTHSRLNYTMIAKGNVRYADMTLWQEIIFLQWVYKGNFVVENVITYYDPLIKPQLLGRHYYWSNKLIANVKEHINDDIAMGTVKTLQKHHNINLDNYISKKKRLMLRNCVNPKHGLHIFNSILKEKQQTIDNW